MPKKKKRQRPPKERMIKILTILLLIYSPFILGMRPEVKKKLENNSKHVEKMVNDGKNFILELKNIRKACRVLEKKFHGKKECPKFSKQIMTEVKYMQNLLSALNHPFWAYLKGAAKYAEDCASCDEKKTREYCPLLEKALERYDVIY